MRLELQSEKGDTADPLRRPHRADLRRLHEHALPLHAAARRTGDSGRRPTRAAQLGEPRREHHEVPSVAKIEEAISTLSEHANVSGATPTDVAGQAAYTVRVSPNESGSLIGGAELSWDAVHGVPLRAAIYSSTSSSPVIELAATESPTARSKPRCSTSRRRRTRRSRKSAPDEARHEPGAAPRQQRRARRTSRTHGHGLARSRVLESQTKAGAGKPRSGAAEKACRR